MCEAKAKDDTHEYGEHEQTWELNAITTIDSSKNTYF